MKFPLKILLAFLLLACPTLAQVPVTGNLKDITGTNVTSNAEVDFELQNYGSEIPKVTSSGVVVQVKKVFKPDTNGLIHCVGTGCTDTVYQNSVITPGGTFYRVCVINQGTVLRCNNYLINSSFNLNSAPPLNVIPNAGPNQIVTQSFICLNPTPSTVWTCTHNFNDSHVQVQAFNLSGAVIYPDTVVSTSANVVTITFVTAQSGLAVILHAGSIAIATNQPNAVLQNPTGSQTICCQPLTLLDTAPFNTNATDAHNGIENFNAAMNANAGGTLNGTFAGNPTLSGNLVANGTVTANNGVTANSLTDGGLTPGKCLQAGTAGLLTTTNDPCGGTGAAGVTSFAYAETGLDALESSVVTNSTTAPVLTQTAAPVPAGTFFAGPVPSGSVTNPTYENGAVAGGTGTVVAVTAAPAAATSVAIYFANTSDAQSVAAPGGWSDFPAAVPGTNSLPHYKNISSAALLTASSTITSATWASSLQFLGGSITSIPQNVSLSGCGTGCISGALGAVTAGHTILVFGYWASGSIIPDDVRVSDSVGNGYLLASFAPNLSSNGHFIFIAQNVASGTPIITVRTSKGINFSGAIAYDLTGPGPYYTGPNGPWAPRRITAADLSNAGIQTIQSFGSSSLGGNVTIGNTATFVASVTRTMPAVGCPCRVFISFSLAIDFAGVTNQPNIDFWVSDGTNSVIPTVETGQSNASATARTSATYSGFTSGIYGAGSPVTFTLFGIQPGAAGAIVKAAPLNGAGSNFGMQAAVFTSN